MSAADVWERTRKGCTPTEGSPAVPSSAAAVLCALSAAGRG